jgi:type II secretory pathway pseudopilin PulG
MARAAISRQTSCSRRLLRHHVPVSDLTNFIRLRHGTCSGHAFTLIEVALVVIVTGILAVTVIPAWSSMTGARQAAAAEEVERRLVAARSQAVAEGRPVGVRIDPASDTVRLFVITTPGVAPTPGVMFDGQTSPELHIPSTYPGADILSLAGGDGTGGAQVLWFGFDGSPQLRDMDGTLVGGWTAHAIVTLSGGQQVTVLRDSGMVQR